MSSDTRKITDIVLFDPSHSGQNIVRKAYKGRAASSVYIESPSNWILTPDLANVPSVRVARDYLEIGAVGSYSLRLERGFTAYAFEYIVSFAYVNKEKGIHIDLAIQQAEDSKSVWEKTFEGLQSPNEQKISYPVLLENNNYVLSVTVRNESNNRKTAFKIGRISLAPNLEYELPVVRHEAIKQEESLAGQDDQHEGNSEESVEPVAYVSMSTDTGENAISAKSVSQNTLDILQYMRGDGRVYDVAYNFPGGPGSGVERMQTQIEGRRFFHVKGQPNSFQYNWEELWFDDNFIYRGTDTSPEAGQLYQTFTGSNYGHKWIPRFAAIGDKHKIECRTEFKFKSNGLPVPNKNAYTFTGWIQVYKLHAEYSFGSTKLENVLELRGYLNNDGDLGLHFETYFYAARYGLVAWQDPTKDWKSGYSGDVPQVKTLPREQIAWLQLRPLPEYAVPVITPISESDPQWVKYIVSPVSNGGANIRYGYSTTTPVIGRITSPTVALLMPTNKQPASIKAGEQYWYPIRLAASANPSEYSLFGYIRQDVLTYQPYVEPEKPITASEKIVTIKMVYDPQSVDSTLLVDAMNKITQALEAKGVLVEWKEI